MEYKVIKYKVFYNASHYPHKVLLFLIRWWKAQSTERLSYILQKPFKDDNVAVLPTWWFNNSCHSHTVYTFCFQDTSSKMILVSLTTLQYLSIFATSYCSLLPVWTLWGKCGAITTTRISQVVQCSEEEEGKNAYTISKFNIDNC